MSQEDNQQNNQEEQEYRVMPSSDLDFNMLLTDSVWGKQEVPKELRDKLSKLYVQAGLNGEEDKVTKESLWGLLGFYTRDMRLGNISMKDGTYQYVTYHLDLANDLLNADMIEPFIIALSRAATQLEISQSKGGFLRKENNTLHQKNQNENLEPPKKGMFGGFSSKNNGGQ